MFRSFAVCFWCNDKITHFITISRVSNFWMTKRRKLLCHSRVLKIHLHKVSCNSFLCVCVFTQVLGTLRATDKDDRPASFTFSLAGESSNFSIRDYGSKPLHDLPRLYHLWLKAVLRGALTSALLPCNNWKHIWGMVVHIWKLKWLSFSSVLCSPSQTWNLERLSGAVSAVSNAQQQIGKIMRASASADSVCVYSKSFWIQMPKTHITAWSAIVELFSFPFTIIMRKKCTTGIDPSTLCVIHESLKKKKKHKLGKRKQMEE